jgi:hypothetical protein
MWLVCVALPCLAIAAIGAVASVAGATSSHPHTVCFPAAKWDAPQRYRPCVHVGRVLEDGSFTYSVTDADGTVRYSAGVGAKDR